MLKWLLPVCLIFYLSLIVGIPFELSISEQVSLTPPYIVYVTTPSSTSSALMNNASEQYLFCEGKKICLLRPEVEQIITLVPNRFEVCANEKLIPSSCNDAQVHFSITTRDWLLAGLFHK